MSQKTYEEKRFNAILVFAWIFLFGSFLLSIFLTRGLSIRKMFFNNMLDTIMDFGNSIRDGQDYTAYSTYHVIYPPLCNLFFRFLALFFPAYYLDKNTYRYEIYECPQLYVFYFIFVSLCILILYFSINRFLREYHPVIRITIVVLLVLTYPMLYALERGNIILLSISALFGFICLHNDEKRVYRELSLIFLALSIVIKMYPIIFALLLVKEKRWRDLTKAGIYTMLLFFFPFVFYGGMSDLFLLLKYAFGHFSGVTPDTNSSIGLFLFHFGLIAYNSFAYRMLSYLFIVLFAFAGYKAKDDYLSCLCFGLSLLCFPGSSGEYCQAYLLPALFLILFKKKLDWLELLIALCLVTIATVNGFFRNNFYVYMHNEITLYVFPILYILTASLVIYQSIIDKEKPLVLQSQ